jgi:hypothetical protein
VVKASRAAHEALPKHNECDLALSKCPAWGPSAIAGGSREPGVARDETVEATLSANRA